MDKRITPKNIVKNIPPNGYALRALSSDSREYCLVKEKFDESGKCDMVVSSIQSIDNPIQRALYELKKREAPNGYSGDEVDLFHGTKNAHLDSICRNNLDRRRCVQHKFGHGVSFSPVSYYASHYCDRDAGQKVMLLCKVITRRGSLGHQLSRIPSPGCDHTRNIKGDVIVKYDDYSYCPEYVIRFTMNQTRPYRSSSSLYLGRGDLSELEGLLNDLQF